MKLQKGLYVEQISRKFSSMWAILMKFSDVWDCDVLYRNCRQGYWRANQADFFASYKDEFRGYYTLRDT